MAADNLLSLRCKIKYFFVTELSDFYVNIFFLRFVNFNTSKQRFLEVLL